MSSPADREESEAPYVDPVIEAYKKDIDRTLFRENRKLTVDQRIQNLQNVMRDFEEFRGAVRRAKASQSTSAVVQS
jgi:hypothetical protein